MAKKIGIPCEFKYELALNAWSTMLAGFMYVIREEFDAATAVRLTVKLFKRDDRLRNLTNMIKTIFKIEGKDVEAIADYFDTYAKIIAQGITWLERSNTIAKCKIVKCPFKTGYKDLRDWCKIWHDIVVKTINPKAFQERPKAMCAGDTYCEFVYKIEE